MPMTPPKPPAICRRARRPNHTNTPTNSRSGSTSSSTLNTDVVLATVPVTCTLCVSRSWDSVVSLSATGIRDV